MIRTSILALAVFGLGAPAALALTPEEVWAMWQAQSAAQGQTLTAASVQRAGDTLVLTGVALKIEPAGETMRVNADIGSVLMREEGEAVAITMADSYPIAITGLDSDGGPGSVTLRVSQPGLTLTAEGEADSISYSFAAPSIAITLERIEAKEPVETEVAVTLTGVEGAYSTAGTDRQEIDSEFTAAGLTVRVAAKQPGGKDAFGFDLTSADVGLSFGGVLVPGFGTEDDMAKLLAEGLVLAGGYNFGATTFGVDALADGQQTSAQGSFGKAAFDFGLSSDSMDYATSTEALDLTLRGGDMPFPELRVTLAELGLGFAVPLQPTPDPAEFGLLARLVDLALPDDLWAMADPTGTMPREPLTVILDASGLVRLTQSLLSPDAMQGAAPPGELHALEVTEMQAKGLGADLTGSGSFTFDNTDLATFDGLPRPAGALDLQLVGGNALIDRLAAMGMIPEDQLMGVRMMLGLFARPGSGPDTLVSRIEVTPAGEVLANGQRIR